MQLSWRLSGIVQASRRLESIKILNGGGPQEATAPPDLEQCIRRQLATVGAQSGAREVTHQVIKQLERTLHDFPCLKSCSEIGKYAMACSRLAWACLARSAPLLLDMARCQNFDPEIHLRHRSSWNMKSQRIKVILWPGLKQSPQGPYLHKTVVMTG